MLCRQCCFSFSLRWRVFRLAQLSLLDSYSFWGSARCLKGCVKSLYEAQKELWWASTKRLFATPDVDNIKLLLVHWVIHIWHLLDSLSDSSGETLQGALIELLGCRQAERIYTVAPLAFVLLKNTVSSTLIKKNPDAKDKVFIVTTLILMMLPLCLGLGWYQYIANKGLGIVLHWPPWHHLTNFKT